VDPVWSQRQRFVRHCAIVGATLAVLGAAGLARLALMSLGGLVLVFGLLAYVIGLLSPPVVDDEAPALDPGEVDTEVETIGDADHIGEEAPDLVVVEPAPVVALPAPAP
jgi:hypothetical protein